MQVDCFSTDIIVGVTKFHYLPPLLAFPSVKNKNLYLKYILEMYMFQCWFECFRLSDLRREGRKSPQ